MKFNVHRVDNMIIQTIAILDQLDKDINTFSMRIRFVGTNTFDIMQLNWTEQKLHKLTYQAITYKKMFGYISILK